MHIRSKSFHEMQPIPSEFAFGQPGVDGEPCVLAPNRNPHLTWSDVPAGTRSFVLTCIDPDVPSVGDDVNQVGRSVRADLARVEFVHWLMVDIPAEFRELAPHCRRWRGHSRQARTVGPPGGCRDVTTLQDVRADPAWQATTSSKTPIPLERRAPASLSFPRACAGCCDARTRIAIHAR